MKGCEIVLGRIKKFFRAVIFVFIKKGNNHNGAEDVLNTPIDIAGRLCEHLKCHRHNSIEQTVESVTMHKFAVLLRRKLCSMKRTGDATLFNAMYCDAVMFAEGIADNKSLDLSSRNMAKDLLDYLVHLADSDSATDGIFIYKVVFGGGGKRYCYKGSNAFCKGQYVCVPVGDEGEIRVVRITEICGIDEYEGDFPTDNMKEILSNAFLNMAVAEAMGKNNC